MLKRQVFQPMGAFSYNKNEKLILFVEILNLGFVAHCGGGATHRAYYCLDNVFLVVYQICPDRQLKKKRKNHFVYYFTYNSLH